MDENNIFSIRMREARIKNDMSQAELSRNTGIAPATLSSYEKGKNPPIDKALSIARALNVSLDWLCCNDEQNDNDFNTIPFREIAEFLIKLFSLNGIEFEETNMFDAYVDHEILSSIKIYSHVLNSFLSEYNRIRDLINNSDYPQYLKDGLKNAVLEKFENYYIENGKICGDSGNFVEECINDPSPF